VETILAKKGRGPTAQYLVKWLGYEEVTWLPAGELDQSVELVDEFEKRDKEKKELALSTTEATRKRVYADQQPKGNFAVPRRSHQEPAGPFSNGLIPTSNGPLTSVSVSLEFKNLTHSHSFVGPLVKLIAVGDSV
jgi:Chromo (CHRromatin Organisation MOdifier) domain